MAHLSHTASTLVRYGIHLLRFMFSAALANAFLLPTSALADCNPTNIPPAIEGQLYEGQVFIRGTAPLPQGCQASVEIHDTSNGQDVVLPIGLTTNFELRNSHFGVRLMKPLKMDQQIKVVQVFKVPDKRMDSEVMAVYRKPVIAGPLREGASEIKGSVTVPPNTCAPAKVEVHALSPGDQVLAQNEGASSTTPAADGAYDAKLQNPLKGNQWIRIDLVCPKFRLSSDVAGVDVPGDWGRIKSYFTTGILLSQDQNSFSQSSLFLGFALDNAWRLPGWYHQHDLMDDLQAKAEKAQKAYQAAQNEQGTKDDTAHKQASQKQQDKAQKKYEAAQAKLDRAMVEGKKERMGRAPGFNTFVEVRLTSIPVSACSTTTSTTSTSSATSPCAPTPTPTPPPSGPAPTPTPPLETFLSQRKTARIVVGGYFPWTVKAWTYHNVRNGLFLAPLAKVGFDTPTGELNQIQPASAGTTTITNTNTVTAVNPASFYNFYGFGGRVGHYELTSPRYHDLAPEMLSHLDIIFGPFSNLESLVQPENPVKNGTNISRKRIWRLAIEGVYKVPTTPMVIGFSANIGQEAVGVGPFNVVQRAPDDLRFLFGLKFDVGKLVSRLGQISP